MLDGGTGEAYKPPTGRCAQLLCGKPSADPVGRSIVGPFVFPFEQRVMLKSVGCGTANAAERERILCSDGPSKHACIGEDLAKLVSGGVCLAMLAMGSNRRGRVD